MGLSWGPDGADSGIPLYTMVPSATTPTTTTAATLVIESNANGSTVNNHPPQQQQQQQQLARRSGLSVSSPAVLLPPQPVPAARTPKMPVMAVGTWQLDANGIRKALRTAIVECGYRAIDCASIHQNEKEVGEVLQEIFSMRKKVTNSNNNNNNSTDFEPLVKREDLFITSKLWNDAHASQGGADKSRVLAACKKTLRDLQLDYLDLYLVNHPVGFVANTLDATAASQINTQASLTETWDAMQELVELGLVRAIGVANFEVEHIEAILKSPHPLRIKPLVNQIETHPYLLRTELIQYCHNKVHFIINGPSKPPSLCLNTLLLLTGHRSLCLCTSRITQQPVVQARVSKAFGRRRRG